MADTEVASVEQRNAFTACLTDPPNFSIRIEGYEWRVHKEVLSKQSKFFEKACNGQFKESRDNIVRLHEDCPYTVALMVQWFYRTPSASLTNFLINSIETMDKMMLQNNGKPYFEKLKESFAKREIWKVHASLYKLADKYNVEDLKEVTRSSIVAAVAGKGAVQITCQDVVECIGIGLVAADKELFQPLLEISWRRGRGIKDMLTLWYGFTGADEALGSTIEQFAYSQADKLQADQKTILEAIDAARLTLAEARSRLTYHPNNNPAKEKIIEAGNMLRAIQEKHDPDKKYA